MLAPLAPLSFGSGVPRNASGVPSWRAGQALNTWRQISGTSGAGGAHTYAYSGMAMSQAGRIFIGGAAGHGDGHSNRVVSLNLMADAPSWVTLRADTASPTDNTAYYPDGARAASHTYWQSEYIESVGKLMIAGFRYGYPGANTYANVDSFNEGTGNWDPAGTWPNMPAGYYGSVYDPVSGVWYAIAQSVSAKWNASTKVWSVAANPFPGGHLVTRSQCWDSTRNLIMAIGFGPGDDFAATDFRAHTVNAAGNTATPVTVNASAAYTTLLAEIPMEWGITYDPVNDCYWGFHGGTVGSSSVGGVVGRVYKFVWNGANLDCSILSMGVGNDPPVAVASGGVNNRFRYVAALGGCVYVPGHPTTPENVRFLRTH